MKSEEAAVKQQKIAPGITMEKLQERLGDTTYYVIRIDLQIFNVLEFSIDFSGSVNVKLQGSIGLTKNTTVQPFSKVEVARLILNKQWSIKTKFRFSIKLPSLDLQRKHLEGPRKKVIVLRQLNEKNPIYDVENLMGLLRDAQFEFMDVSFPPIDANIEVDEAAILSRYECLVDWRTPKQIATRPEDVAAGRAVEPPVYSMDIRPEHIKGGKMENFWLQSALAALAERPQFVRTLVQKVEGKQSSAYIVNLYEMGVKRQVIVDQYVPCVPLGGPIFTSSSEGDLWVSLVEKAFAKVHGGYQSLRLGHVKSGLVSLTNCPTFNFDLKEDNSALIVRSIKFFGMIKEWLAKHYLIVASAGAFPTTGDSQEASTHGYAIVNYLEIDHSRFPVPNLEKSVSQILNIRNPWGVFDWAGDWSASSPLWTEQIRTYYEEYLHNTQGSFWISIENFLENFSGLTVSLTQGWHHFHGQSAFVRCTDTSQDNATHFSTRHYYQITIPERSHVVFGLHQEDERNPGVYETRPNIDIGLVLLSVQDGIYRLKGHIDSAFVRETYLEAVLEPGTYLIVPKSVGVFLGGDQKFRQRPFDPNGVLEKSVLGAIFDKYDQTGAGHIASDHFETIIKALDLLSLSPNLDGTLKNLIATAKRQPKVSKQQFIQYFGVIADGLGPKNLPAFLRLFGHNENYACDGMRTFGFTVHSSSELSVDTRDALEDKMELVTFKLLLKNHGKAVDQKKTVSGIADLTDVECFYYFNE